MYRFARVAQLAGDPVKSTGWAVTITEKVNRISAVPVTLWTTVLSQPLGLVVWTASVDNVSEIETTDAKLMVDSGYLDLQAAGVGHIIPGSISDSLATVVFQTPGAAQGHFHCVAVTMAQIQPGQFRRGVELGVEFAQRANALTGLETSFATSVTGTMGTVSWTLIADSLDELQRGQDKLDTDESFVTLIDPEGAKAYSPGATVGYLRRLI